MLTFPGNQHARHDFNIKMEQRVLMVPQRPPAHHPVSPVINTALWSFSWRWRAEQQRVLGPLSWSPLWPRSHLQREAPPLTGSVRRPPSVLLWSSSFDHLSHPVSTSPFSSQKGINSEQSVNLSGWEATNANVKNREYIWARAARTCPLKTYLFVKTAFEKWAISVCAAVLPEAAIEIWWQSCFSYSRRRTRVRHRQCSSLSVSLDL